MCTSIVVNRKKTIVGWNLDILNMEYRVRPSERGVYIEINDEQEGWLPLFGANSRGDFVGMPTCWPYDDRSDPIEERCNEADTMPPNVIMLDIDLLLQNKTLQEIRSIAEREQICSVPGVTFMAALSDAEGNVLRVIPGQGYEYLEKPDHSILTNFAPFKMDREVHPWMGWERYHLAERMIESARQAFDVADCFAVLKAVAQKECPTVVSMVFDVDDRTVYWCEEQNWDDIRTWVFGVERGA